MRKNLHISKKSCNFAPKLKNNPNTNQLKTNKKSKSYENEHQHLPTNHRQNDCTT